MISQAMYIWIDGAKPTKKMRCKKRILELPKNGAELSDFPDWGFDGSSTYQAEGSDSDLILKPVSIFDDPILGEGNYLVLCEVFITDDQPHPTNTRAKLRHLINSCQKEFDPYIGFEQEYTLLRNRTPLGWPDGGYPAPQGPFYCGVGADEVFGRQLSQAHVDACLSSNILLFGTNAEVMPGQWEFQIGYRGFDGEVADPLTVSDHLWIARWLLYLLGEPLGISATLDNKPVKGDWNGAGMHTNFSTKQTRDKSTGKEAIQQAIANLEKNHMKHIHIYGAGLGERLTGLHETSSLEDFSSGDANRGASVRIPKPVARKGYGYLEDRRPGANADPYEVSSALLESICNATCPDEIS